MERKSIKKNYLFNLCYQVLLIITPLITAPYIARVLEADGVGVISYVSSVATYFTLFATMGITTYGQREISYVQDIKNLRSNTFWNIKVFQSFTAIIIFVIYIFFAILQENPYIYIIFSLNILSVVVDVSWFFQGLEEFGKTILVNIVFKLSGIIYIFLFVRTKDDLLVYAFGLSFFTFLGNISLWKYLPRYIEKIDRKNIHPFKDVKMVLSFFLPTIAIEIYTVLDKIMIGVITKDAFENGYYEQAIRISKLTLSIVTALGVVMIPRIGYHFKRKDYEEVKKLIYRGYQFVWFIGIPICLGLIVVAKNFIPWFLGDGYDKVVSLIGILSFLIITIGISNVTGMQYMIPTGKQKTFTYTVIIGACVNFILNLILIPKFQSTGASIASVVAEMSITIIQLVTVRKEISIWEVVKLGRNYCLAGLIMAHVVECMGRGLTPNLVHTIMLISCGSVVYISILFILHDKFLISNIKLILKRNQKEFR